MAATWRLRDLRVKYYNFNFETRPLIETLQHSYVNFVSFHIADGTLSGDPVTSWCLEGCVELKGEKFKIIEY